MRLPRLILISMGAALLALAPGCKGQCRSLSEKLCDCSLNSVEKENCLRRASQVESGVSPSAEEEAVCAALIEGCDCHNIDTAEGKKACGLAR